MIASKAQMPWVEKLSVKLVMVTRVEASTAKPVFCKPIKAMKRPIPTEIPRFRVKGMALKIASRTLVRDRTIKSKPSAKTAKRATCQD